MFQALRAYAELVRYEFVLKLGGFRRIHECVRSTPVVRKPAGPDTVRQVCDVVTLASCFFWKPVLCLPRAFATTRLLRKQGIKAEMVIGYRPSPFFSHAWVEVDGVIVNDSPAYQQRLLVLERL